jgi:hypothetical protein
MQEGTMTYADAFAPVSGTNDTDRRHALRFLLDVSGPWAARRDEVAAYIGTEGEIVRRHAQAIIDGAAGLDSRPKSTARLQLEEARLLLEDPRRQSRSVETMRAQAHPELEGRWLCFDVREDGTLVLPKSGALVGLHDGLPLPNGPSFQARVLKELTKPFGASLQTLRKAAKNWESVVKELCDLYDLEVLLKEGPVHVAGGIEDMDRERKAYVRRRLQRAA